MSNGIRLSRSKGLTFGNVVVDNTNGVFLMGVEKPSSPTLDRIDVVSPGRDGSTSFENRRLDKEITVKIGIYMVDLQERRKIQRQVSTGLLAGIDRLYFHDEPDMCHIGRVYDEVNVEEDDFFTVLTFVFKCDPFVYSSPNVVNFKGITSNTSSIINHKGTHQSVPKISINGTASRCGILIGDYAFSISDITEKVIIDSREMVVYTVQNGIKKSKLRSFSGLFPLIKPGDNNIMISGDNLNVSIEISYDDTYIC